MDTIETERLILRPLHPSDAAYFARLLGPDPDAVRQMAQMPDPCTEEAAREWIEARLGPGGYVFAVLLRTGGEFIGVAGFGGPVDLPELGYWIGAPYRGQGYATEAIGGLIEYARQLGVPRIHADTFPNNPASVRVLAKAGFATTGDVERYFPARGGLRTLTRHVYQIAGRRS
jgi:RimJ/RimL family protein N-acetyltransferase